MAFNFLDLMNRFPDAENLLQFLQSPEGGSLQVYRESPENSLVIIRYLKGSSDMENPNTRLFRSVIWDCEKNCPVAMAPVTSEPSIEQVSSELENSNTLPTPATMRVEKFVDGTMIHMFWDSCKMHWEIATRSNLYGITNFRSNLTFRELWFQMPHINMTHVNKDLSFVFVMNHPENQNVEETNDLVRTLVQAHQYENGVMTDCTYSSAMDQMLIELRRVNAKFVESYKDIKTMEEVNSFIQQMAETGSREQGLVIKEIGGQGRRWKLRNPHYKLVALLRGNWSDNKAAVLYHTANGTLNEYLVYFPAQQPLVSQIQIDLSNGVHVLYKWYCDVFKSHSTTLKDAPFRIRPILYQLHGYYLGSLQPYHQTVNWKIASSWVHTYLKPEQMVYLCGNMSLPKVTDTTQMIS